MKKIIALALAALICLSAAACKKSDKDDKYSSAPEKSQGEILEGEGFETRITEETFETLGDFIVNSDHSGVYVTTLCCEKPADLADGVYGCPSLSVTVNGKDCPDKLAYMVVSGEVAAVNISFFGGYVEKDSKISVTLTDFNKLNEPEEEGESVDYDDVSDETVLSGKISLEITAEESFGFLRWDFEDKDGARLTVNYTALSFENCEKLFSERPTHDSVTVLLSDNTEIKFDNCCIINKLDEEGNQLTQYDAVFNFDDTEKTIDISKVSEVRINGNNILP